MSVGQVEAVQQAQTLVGQLGPAVSPRDRAIYKAVCLENRSPVEVGRELGLAATTVRNIAQRTQRALAQRQHQLDEWSDCESLGYFYDCLSLQLEEVQQAWEASRQEGDRVRETTTTTTVTLPSGEKQVADKVVRAAVKQSGPAPVGNIRLISLANSILCHMIGIGVKYKRQRAAEQDEGERRACRGWRGQESGERSEPADGPDEELIATTSVDRAALCGANAALLTPPPEVSEVDQSARELRQLAGLVREIKPRLPSPAPLAGLKENRPGRPQQMSRRERNRREREQARAKSDRSSPQTEGRVQN